MPGSPPLARGKVDHLHGVREHVGITPACAGKSLSFFLPACAEEDHPRLRGEKDPEGRTTLRSWGSPPLARGKANHPGLVAGVRRITPACAGKRAAETGAHGSSWDHPRLRGEKANALGRCEIRTGSPPLARGKGAAISSRTWRTGITPACAGKSARKPCCPSACRDHPRLRGEKKSLIWERSSRIGSPPLARGKA